MLYATFLPCNAMLARYILSLFVCVCVCVFEYMCVFVTPWYCIKMAIIRIMQTKPHDSLGTHSFLMPKISMKFKGDVTPKSAPFVCTSIMGIISVCLHFYLLPFSSFFSSYLTYLSELPYHGICCTLMTWL